MTTTQLDANRVNMALISAIVAVATIGGLLFGYDSGAVNGTQGGLTAEFGLSEAALGFTVGSLLLGCAVGAFLAGRLADAIGRRKVMLISALLFLVGALIQGFTDVHAMFVLARFAGGMAVGAASVLSPLYISEVAPAHLRGRLSSIQQVAIITGLFVAFLSNFLIAAAAGGANAEWMFGFKAWRWMFWIELFPAFIFLIALLFIPESPRFLVVRGKTGEARGVLERISGATRAKKKVDEIEASLANDHKPRLADVLAKGSVLKPIVWIGIGLATFQQLVGINVVFYYGAVLWQAVGFSEGDALLINVISGAVSILAVIVALAVIDRIGRKPLLAVGSVGMAATLGTLVYAFSQASVVNGAVALPEGVGRTALIAANAYVFFFNMSWGPVMWVALGEMFPNQIRGSGLAAAGFFQWFSNFLITMTFPIMLTTAWIGLTGAYGFYTICAVISIFFVVLAVRETKGMELEDMRN